MRFLFVVAALVVTAAGCGSSRSGGSGNQAESLCAAGASYAVECNGDTEEQAATDEAECLMSAFATANGFRPGLIASFETCIEQRPCVDLEMCITGALEDANPGVVLTDTTTWPPSAQTCAAIRNRCEAFDGGLCTGLFFVNDAIRTQASACYDDACEDVEACLRGVLGPYLPTVEDVQGN